MESNPIDRQHARRMTLARMPTPTKALATCVIVVLAIGMLRARGQIVVHDIIPTFYSPSGNDAPAPPSGDHHAGSTPSVILRTIRTVFFFRPPPCRLGAQKICTYAVAVLFSSKRFIGSSDHLQ